MTGADGGADPGARPGWRWDVALSFAGAQRDYVGQVAAALKARGVRCFYDADEQVRLWGTHLAEELPLIYARESAAVVVFVSADYAGQPWTRLERRAALARAVTEAGVYVLPARFDHSELPGLLPDVVYVDLRRYTPREFADLVVAKLADLTISPSGPFSGSSPELALSAGESAVYGPPTIQQSRMEIAARDPAVYLMKVINPPKGQGRQKSTVWAAAAGNITYIFDSITIRHRPGMACSIGSGALPPDATYSFSFKYGSQRTYPLNPAIVLSHEDPREVSFTIGLAPEGRFPTVGGRVYVTLHYHATDGIQGTLEIREPPEEGRLLSRVLNSDVQFDRLVTTPAGTLRGSDDRKYQGTLIYDPIQFPRYSPSDHEQPTALPLLTLTPERLLLNKRLEDQDMLVWLTDLLRDGEDLGFDLCSGLPGLKYEKAVVERGRSIVVRGPATKALAVRHMLNPNDTLADFIMDRQQSAYRWNAYRTIINSYSDHAITALICHPKGKWASALLVLAELRHDEALSALYLMRDSLTDADRRAADKPAWKDLATASHPYPATIKYLRWRGYPDAKIERTLMKSRGCDNYGSTRRAELRDEFFA